MNLLKTNIVPLGDKHIAQRFRVRATSCVVHVFWELAEAGALGDGHGTITFFENVCYGKVATRKLPADLDALPAVTPERATAVLAWRSNLERECREALRIAFPYLRDFEALEEPPVTEFMGDIEIADYELAVAADESEDSVFPPVELAEPPLYNRVAFTGPEQPTPALAAQVPLWFDAQESKELVVIVGGCVGIDSIVAREARRRGIYVHAVIPADRSKVDPAWQQRDFCRSFEQMPAGTSYMDRNDRLIALGQRLVAFSEAPTYYRSGTWATINRGHKARKPVNIFTPAGEVGKW